MLIHVKVEVDSNTNGVIEKNDSSFIVKVKAEAKGNAANRMMLEILSNHLKISQGKLRIITGHHMPGKILEILE